PDLETLHLDNMNPITIVEWPEKSREGIRIIAEHNTPGDTAAFGLESADPVVQEANNLNVTAEECFQAVKIVNDEAGWRPGEDRQTTRRHTATMQGIGCRNCYRESICCTVCRRNAAPRTTTTGRSSSASTMRA
ncbi:MAG: hypothetical protein J07HN4v3_01263, partial [Halonotius sp. J07HN4]